MNAPQNFRSSFNGFNREDVVNHISYMSTKHETLVNQLRSEADALRQELEDLRAQMGASDDMEARVAELEQTVTDRDAEVAEARAETLAVREELALANQLMNEQAEAMAALREELEEAREAAAKPAAIEKSANHWDELRAYRRAETVERRARERVNQLYDHANEALRQTEQELGNTNATFDALAEQFRADLVALMENIEAGRTTLTAAAKTLDTLRPTEDEQSV